MSASLQIAERQGTPSNQAADRMEVRNPVFRSALPPAAQPTDGLETQNPTAREIRYFAASIFSGVTSSLSPTFLQVPVTVMLFTVSQIWLWKPLLTSFCTR